MGTTAVDHTPGSGDLTGLEWGRNGRRQGEQWCWSAAERVGQRTSHDFVHQRLLTEPHLRFGRVDVDVHRIERHLDEQVHLGAALLDRGHAVGVADGVRDRPIAHEAAVHEHVLWPPARSLLGQRGHETGDADAGCVFGHGHQRIGIAVELIQPLRRVPSRRHVEQPAACARQREPDLRGAQGELRQHPRRVRRLRLVGLQELPSSGQVVEEILDVDPRAFGNARLSDRGDHASVDPDLGARDFSAGTRPQREVCDRRDARKGLPAKSQRRNRREILGTADLARGVAFDGQPGILRRHPFPIVLDPNQALAAKLERDHDPTRSRIERVLDQLLDDRGGALDDLTGRDLIGELGRQADDS